MADGLFYRDLKEPFITADIASVTLSTTQKALYPAVSFPIVGSNYFQRVGKKLRIRLFGRMTTVATPGNLTFGAFWGTGADANGTSLGTSTAQALTANKTNLSWEAEFSIQCRALGASGSLLAVGRGLLNSGLMASPILFPDSAPAAVTVDLTAANIISIQAARSGSTAETMQVHDMEVEALN